MFLPDSDAAIEVTVLARRACGETVPRFLFLEFLYLFLRDGSLSENRARRRSLVTSVVEYPLRNRGSASGPYGIYGSQPRPDARPGPAAAARTRTKPRRRQPPRGCG